MSLDHLPMFTERRFQPSDRSSYDPSSWSYSSRASPDSFTPSWNTPSHYASFSYSSPPPPSPPPYSGYRHAPYTLFHPSDCHASSSRAIVPSIHPSLASSLSPPSCPQNTLSHPHPWGDGLYTIDDPETASNSERPASSVAPSPSARASSTASSIPPVKVEPEDPVAADCFVMEFSAPTPASQASISLAPPTEVPLRATQASKAMRRMMGVFRLNPFSMHDSGASGQPATTWTGEEAGPLDQEPQVFEFQLDLPGYERAASDPIPSQPHSSNKLDGDFDDAWAECPEPPLHYSAASHSAWLGNDSSASYTLPSLRPFSPHPALHSPSSSSGSPRRTPLDATSSDYSPYTLPMSSSCATSIDNLPSISTMARRWSNTTNLQHPFMI